MYFVEPIFRGLMLNITDDCNLRCKYCFVNKSPNYMSFTIAKDSLDLLMAVNKDLDEKEEAPSITFFGGEPTLCWDTIIVPLVEYAKEQNYRVQFHITSNGILLNEERLKYLQDNNMTLLLSIDGIKECQDVNRPFLGGQGSFDSLKDKLPLIIKYRPETVFRSTLYPPTCYTLFDNIKFAEEQGFTDLFTIPDEGSEWTEEHKQILIQELDKYVDYYIQTVKETGKEPIEFSPITNMFKNIVTYRAILDSGEDYTKTNFPTCGLGIDFASVNYEGKIFACQELPTNNSKVGNKYLIGNIYNGIDKDKHDKLLQEYKKAKLVCSDPVMCDNCHIKPICTQTVCHANSYLLTKTLNTKSVIKCFWDNLLFEEASKIINELGKNDAFIEIYLKRIFNGHCCC